LRAKNHLTSNVNQMKRDILFQIFSSQKCNCFLFWWHCFIIALAYYTQMLEFVLNYKALLHIFRFYFACYRSHVCWLG